MLRFGSRMIKSSDMERVDRRQEKKKKNKQKQNVLLVLSSFLLTAKQKQTLKLH